MIGVCGQACGSPADALTPARTGCQRPFVASRSHQRTSRHSHARCVGAQKAASRGQGDAECVGDSCSPALTVVPGVAASAALHQRSGADQAPEDYDGSRGLSSSRRGWLLTAAGGVLVGTASAPAPAAADIAIKVCGGGGYPAVFGRCLSSHSVLTSLAT